MSACSSLTNARACPLLSASVPQGPGQASLMCGGWLLVSWLSSQRQEKRPLPFWNQETFARTLTAGRLALVTLPAPDQVTHRGWG